MSNGELRINDYACIDDLNVLSISKYLNLFGNPEMLDFFKKKGLIKEESSLIYLTLLGTIFFGKNPQEYYPNLIIEISHHNELYFNNLSEIIIPSNTIKITGTILEMLEKSLNYLETNLTKDYPQYSSYSSLIFFEIIKNCLIHRSYNKKFENASIKIAIFPNCLIFTSPGGEYESNKDQLFKNPKLYQLYQEYSVINNRKEKGWSIIKNELQKAHLPEPEIIITNTFYKVILWNNNQLLIKNDQHDIFSNSYQIPNYLMNPEK